jgi:hypothetical protein
MERRYGATKPGKIHVLGESLSRAQHVINSSDGISKVLNTTEVLSFDRSEIVTNYESDHFFGLLSDLCK